MINRIKDNMRPKKRQANRLRTATATVPAVTAVSRITDVIPKYLKHLLFLILVHSFWLDVRTKPKKKIYNVEISATHALPRT